MNGNKRKPLKTGKENQNVSDETLQQRIELLEALTISQAATINHLQDVIEQLVRSNNELQKTIDKLKNDVNQLKDELAGENGNSGIDSDSPSSPPLIKK